MKKHYLFQIFTIFTIFMFMSCSSKTRAKKDTFILPAKGLIVDGLSHQCLTYNDGLTISKCYSLDQKEQHEFIFESYPSKPNYHFLKNQNQCLTIDDDNKETLYLKVCEPDNVFQLFSFNELSHGQFYRHIIKNEKTDKCIFNDTKNGKVVMSSCYGDNNLLYRQGTMFHIRKSHPSIIFNNPMKKIPSAEKIQIAQDSVFNANQNKKFKHIYILFTDTLRNDRISEELTPNIYQFKKESIKFKKTIAGASSTHHSFFSSLYGRTSLDKDDFIHNSKWNSGSPLLGLLMKLGFKTSFYSPSTFMFCMGHGGEESTEFAYNKLLFGEKSELRSDCSTQEGIDRNKWRPNDENYSRVDEYLLSKFKDDISKKQLNDKDYDFSLVYLYSNHVPYSWLTQDESPSFGLKNPSINSFAPNLDRLAYYQLHDTFDTSLKMKFINSYNNSAMHTDNAFKDFITTLKKNNLYDDAIVIFFSDHGEDLFENGNYLEHGGPNYESRINIPILIKPPKDFHTESKFKEIASSYDIFPIIFDLLGIDYSALSSYLVGESGLHLKEKSKDCTISVSPNGYNYHADQFAFVNSDFKVYLQFDDVKRTLKEQRTSNNKINIIGFENTSSKKEFNIDQKDIHSFIINNFSSCINKLFPTDTNFVIQ